MIHAVRILIAVVPLAISARVVSADQPVINIEDRRELFVDTYLIDQMDGVVLMQHQPVDRGLVFAFDKPWEGPFSGFVTVIRDGDLYRMYYRGGPQLTPDGSYTDEVTCYAESKDGIHWFRPDLGLYEVANTTNNNVILAYPDATTERTPTHNFSPMLDTNPNADPNKRYKAIGGTTEAGGLFAYASADGIHWEKLAEERVMQLEGWVFDSQNVSFWSEIEQKYVLYYRHTINRFRSVARAESDDYINWSGNQLMVYNDTGTNRPLHQMYTNNTQPYFRAPHLYIATPARFIENRQVVTKEEAADVGVHPKYFGDVSDAVLLTSRDGRSYDHFYTGALVRPGIGAANWTSRTNYPALNIVQTGEHEMSLYVIQNYAQPTSHLRRYSMRLDGFMSVSASLEGGEMVTRPLTFTGDCLLLNFATSAAGGIRVEIQDEAGTPIPGFTLNDCQEVIGNEIERAVRWSSGSDVSSLAGRAIRLRFVMKDADLYSFRFRGMDAE